MSPIFERLVMPQHTKKGKHMNVWPKKLTREQAIKLIDDLTFKDDPYWEEFVSDYYHEATDSMPTIYHIFKALGVTKEEYQKATGAQNVDCWPAA
jgi:hypothetical protein